MNLKLSGRPDAGRASGLDANTSALPRDALVSVVGVSCAGGHRAVRGLAAFTLLERPALPPVAASAVTLGRP